MDGGTSLRELAFIEAKAAFSERDPNTVADHNMIQDIHIKELTSLHDLAGHQDILGAWRRVATGVIVSDNQGGAVPSIRACRCQTRSPPQVKA